jgi:hypothetical protein
MPGHRQHVFLMMSNQDCQTLYHALQNPDQYCAAVYTMRPSADYDTIETASYKTL